MIRLVCDRNLGSLARWLRILGFDTTYPDLPDDASLAALAESESRKLLTRDRELAARKAGVAYLVQSESLDDQIVEVLEKLGLAGSILPMTRCSACNGLLNPVSRESVESLLPPRVREFQHEYKQCADCGKVYWPGTHFERMNGRIRRLMTEVYDKMGND